MKLCYTIPHFSSNSSSNYFHQLELIKKLGKKHHIFLFAESGNGHIKDLPLSGFHLQKFTFFPLRVIERFFIFSHLRFLGYKKYYFHYSELSTIIASLITRLTGGQTYKWHCVQEHKYSKPWQIKYFPEKITREIPLLFAYKLCSYLVTCTPYMRSYFHDQYHMDLHKILVIPNYVNVKRFKSLKTSIFFQKKQLNLSKHAILLFVHWLSHRKGADRLIQLALQIKDHNLKQQIIAIGDGPLFHTLQTQIKQFKLEKQLKLLGPIPNRRIQTYFQASDFLIMPSRIEEFGRVQIEAMAAGLPILQTKTAASSILHPSQKKYVVKQSQYLQLPHLADQLIKDKKRYTSLVILGKKWVQQFSLNHVCQLFEQIVINEN